MKIKMRAQIQKRQTLDGALSASALERVGDFWYIIGDDAPALYRLDDAFQNVGAIPLTPAATHDNARTPKAVKLDLEAMTTVVWRGRRELLLFGSGSQTPTRDFGFRVDVTDAAQPRVTTQIALTALYNLLRKQPQLVGAQKLNLEAAAATTDEIFLFQRGNIADHNALAAFDRASFMAYLEQPTRAAPSPRVTRFSMPSLQKRKAGFAAATSVNDSQILFAATVEDTDNEIDDGATLGSFIGLLTREPTWRIAWVVPVEWQDKIAPVKIEGLALKQFAGAEIILYGVTDADGAPSEILEIEIR
ncbi:MAG: hypothetical protein HDKAJFGB_00401 [Anaerolineae bacterium]|nr:hypothetical protein [Anaerolineae bacterium]